MDESADRPPPDVVPSFVCLFLQLQLHVRTENRGRSILFDGLNIVREHFRFRSDGPFIVSALMRLRLLCLLLGLV